MDERLELAEPLFDLTRDPDLWTRLQALRTLRQWFYRTNDRNLARRIVATYLERMSHENQAVVRKNLSEGLYIMLDENLGGGVSLQKNISELPEAMRAGILDARKTFERDVLLTPVLGALRQGDNLQRAGVLDAFDGSFFKGRFYARQPSGMIDVGNDREFGFLHEPGLQELEAAFIPLLAADLPAEPRRQAIQLASFFHVPSQTRSPEIQKLLLRRLGDPDESVRAVARTVVAGELDLNGAERDPERMDSIVSAMDGNPAELEAILGAIGRTERLVGQPRVMAVIRRLMNRDEAAPALLPVLRWPVVGDEEVLSIVIRAWPRLAQPQRLLAIEAMLARPALVDVANPREQVMQILRQGVTDPSPAVRERTLRGVNALPGLWRGKGSTSLLLAALADDTPGLRKLGLTLASTKPGFWGRADAREYLKRLLIDPDPADPARGPRGRRPAFADPGRAGPGATGQGTRGRPQARDSRQANPRAQGIDPASIEADAHLARPRLLSLATFRRKVFPLFYQAGEDGQSCADVTPTIRSSGSLSPISTFPAKIRSSSITTRRSRW